MRRETHEELTARMLEADRLAPKGYWMRHVKSGDLYIIAGHSLRENDLEALVHYRPKFGPAIYFSRPLKEVHARFVLANGDEWPLAEASN